MADSQNPKDTPNLEIASFKDRVIADYIDWAIIISASLLISSFTLPFLSSSISPFVWRLLLVFIFALPALFYVLFFELRFPRPDAG